MAMTPITKKVRGKMDEDVLFTIERREVIAEVKDSPNGEPPLAVGFSIICENIANTIRSDEFQSYEFTYGSHKYVFLAEPVEDE